MSAAFIIEVEGQPAGLVLSEHPRYRFYACDRRSGPLDGCTFATVRQAERAARRLLLRTGGETRPQSPRPPPADLGPRRASPVA